MINQKVYQFHQNKNNANNANNNYNDQNRFSNIGSSSLNNSLKINASSVLKPSN